MFEVLLKDGKSTDKVKVFSVRECKKRIEFLVYRWKTEEWIWVDSSVYAPYFGFAPYKAFEGRSPR